MNQEIATLLSAPGAPDLFSVARYLEPHLSLIKSQTLNAFYRDLRYHRPTYLQHLPSLVQESNMDYRLATVLRNMIVWIRHRIQMSMNP